MCIHTALVSYSIIRRLQQTSGLKQHKFLSYSSVSQKSEAGLSFWGFFSKTAMPWTINSSLCNVLLNCLLPSAASFKGSCRYSAHLQLFRHSPNFDLIGKICLIIPLCPVTNYSQILGIRLFFCPPHHGYPHPHYPPKHMILSLFCGKAW